jgi:hypothetical protein
MNEAFVYKWMNDRGEYYIGVHTGTPEDGYIGSGKLFRERYDVDPSKWNRDIIQIGSTKEMYLLEKDLVTKETLKDPLCLNLTKGGRGFPWWDLENNQQ